MVTVEELKKKCCLNWIGTFVLWSIFLFYTLIGKGLTKEDCGFNLEETFFTTQFVFFLFNIFHTFSCIRLLFILDDTNNERFTQDYQQVMKFCVFLILFLFFNGSIAFSNLVKSRLVFTNDTTCNTTNAQIVFIMQIVLFLWIFLGISLIAFYYLLYGIFLGSSYFFNKYIKKIPPTSNEKNTQTNEYIIIPMESLQTENNILCTICIDKRIDILLEPCGHFCICNDCYLKIEKRECPCCKMIIREKRAVFVSI